jgi:hypothetical protein
VNDLASFQRVFRAKINNALTEDPPGVPIVHIIPNIPTDQSYSKQGESGLPIGCPYREPALFANPDRLSGFASALFL